MLFSVDLVAVLAAGVSVALTSASRNGTHVLMGRQEIAALDALDFPRSGPVTGPLAAAQEYSAVTRWLRDRTGLPVWWMESHIQPWASGWSAQRATAIRVAALLRTACGGAAAALQWQPEQGEGIPDEGLWTATRSPAGGRPTVLARLLPRVLAVLREPVHLILGQPAGIVVVTGLAGSVAVNTTPAASTARLPGHSVALRPGQVRVTSYTAAPQGARASAALGL